MVGAQELPITINVLPMLFGQLSFSGSMIGSPKLNIWMDPRSVSFLYLLIHLSMKNKLHNKYILFFITFRIWLLTTMIFRPLDNPRMLTFRYSLVIPITSFTSQILQQLQMPKLRRSCTCAPIPPKNRKNAILQYILTYRIGHASIEPFQSTQIQLQYHTVH